MAKCHGTAVFMRTGKQGKPNGLQAAPPYLEALLEPKHNVDMPRIHGNIDQPWALYT